jgi:hypothetical protein
VVFALVSVLVASKVAVATSSPDHTVRDVTMHCGALQVVVRKMACHNGLAFGKDKAVDRGARDSGRGNKRKTPSTGGKRPTAAGKGKKLKQA